MAWFAAATVSILVSLAVSRAVIAARLWDAPDSPRKAHRAPTPTSGGLGIMSGAAAGLLVATAPPLSGWAEPLDAATLGRMLIAWAVAGLAGALGAADDLKPLSARLKLVLLAALAAGFAAFGARVETIVLGGPITVPLGPVLGAAGTALFAFTCINAVNFMDGANGLAGGTIAVTLAGFGAIGLLHDAPHAAMLSFTVAAATLGFLVWNAPGGRLFAGDAGSLFLGAIAAFVGLILVVDAAVSPLVIAIGLFPLLFDVLETLVWRRRQRRDLLSAHRDHLYQVGLRAGLSHRRMAAIYTGVAAHCALLAVGCAYAGRVDPLAVAEAAGPDALWAPAAAWLAAGAAPLALLALTFTAWKVARRVRAYAAAQGLDQP